jgi:hypothetical protein
MEGCLTEKAVLRSSLKGKRGYEEDLPPWPTKLGILEPKTTRFYTGGLPNEASGDLPRDQRNEPIVAHDIADAVGPILPYRQATVKKKLTESLIYLESDEATGESINPLARFSHGLDEKQQSDLGYNDIALSGADGPLFNHERAKAAEALARLEKHGHLTLKQRMINEAVMGSLGLSRRIGDRRRAVKAEAGGPSPVASNAQNEQAEMPLVGRNDYLERRRHTASTAVVYIDHGRLHIRRPITEEIPELYNYVRAQLVASARNDRER